MRGWVHRTRHDPDGVECSPTAAVWLMALAVITIGLAGCSSGPQRDDAGQLTQAASMSPFDLKLGDCLQQVLTEQSDPSNLSAEVSTVDAVTCDQPHDLEVYHVFGLTGDTYPGAEAVNAAWIERCEDELLSFAELSQDLSTLYITALYPTEQSWIEANDREVLCMVGRVDDLPLTGSLV